jgi:hypothetical protein
MKSRRQRRPQFDDLEPIHLLSTAWGAIPAQTAHVGPRIHADAAKHVVTPTGTARGNYWAYTLNPDLGTTYTFRGIPAQVSPFGGVTLTGTIKSPGNVANGRAKGTLTLADAKGSVTFAVTGPRPTRGAATTTAFTYQITKSTGRFQGDVGSGNLVITLEPNPTLNPTLNQTGRFTVTFLKSAPSMAR